MKNILARGHTSHLFGPPGCGKSGLLSSAAVSLGSKSEWHGFKIRRKCATVYFPFERAELVKKRIWAECQRDGIDSVPVAVSGGLINLMDAKCVNEIVGTMLAAEDRLGLEVGLGIFDTVNKGIAAGGGDENTAKDQNRAWGNLRRIHEAMARYHGVHLAGIGHTGKDESRGARGSNASEGDNDVTFQIRDDGLIKSIEIAKANELPMGPLMRFKMQPYNTGLVDEDDEPIEVWIVGKEAIEAKRPATKAAGWPPKLRIFQRVLLTALADQGKSARPFLDGPEVRACDVEMLRPEFYRQYHADGTKEQKKKAREKAFLRHRQAADDHGLTTTREIDSAQLIWLTNPEATR